MMMDEQLMCMDDGWINKMQEKDAWTGIVNAVSMMIRRFGLWIVFMSMAYYKIITDEVCSGIKDCLMVSFASFVPMVIGIVMWICGKDKHDGDGMIGYILMWIQRMLCLRALFMNINVILFLIGMMIDRHNCP